MAWPETIDYNQAIQNPGVCFRDKELKQGRSAEDLFGVPRPYAGSFASVYHMTCPGDEMWAVKCFTREVRGLHARYEKISEHLKKRSLPFMVDFDYQEEGILVRGAWYPILKMRWVEGWTLNAFIEEHLEKRSVFEQLAQMWIKLAQQLQEAEIGHGDLQHGNVMLVPRGSSFLLRLIDYDGMHVPLLADSPSAERGHVNYQHPERSENGGYYPEVDRFSHLLIYTTLRALRVAAKTLWGRHHNGDNLLFKKEDIASPAESRLFRDLWNLGDAEVRALAGRTVLATRTPQEQVPKLDTFLEGGLVRLLSAEEEAEVQGLLGLDGKRRKSKLAARVTSAIPPLPASLEIPESGDGLPPWIVPEAVPVNPPPADTAGTVDAKALVETSQGPAVRPLTVVPIPVKEGPVSPATGPVFKVVEVPDDTPSRRELSVVHPVELHPEKKSSPAAQEPPSQPDSDDPSPDDSDPDETEDSDRRSRHLVVVGSALGVVALIGLGIAIWKMSEAGAGDGGSGPPSVVESQPTLETPGTVIFRAGDDHIFNVRVKRNGSDKLLRIAVENLPRGIQLDQSVVLLEPNQSVTQLRLSTPRLKDSIDALARIKLFDEGGSVLQEIPLALQVTPSPLPTLAPVEVNITLKPGQDETLSFTVDRKGWTEALNVRIKENELPGSITQQPQVVSGNNNHLPLTLRVKPFAIPWSNVVTLELLLQNEVVDHRDVALEIRRAVSANTGPVENPVTVRPPTLVLPPAPPAPAKPPTEGPTREVKIVTCDQVEIHGTFYQAASARRPCVLLVQTPGRRRDEESWVRLARELQRKDYAVLTFDFRGQGESTNVIPRVFWYQSHNLLLHAVSQARSATTIDATTFPPPYLPNLVNDIAAARQYLDERNDLGEVNSSQLLIVGAGEGCILATLWLASESFRQEIVTGPGRPRPSGTPELSRVWGAVMVGTPGRLGGLPVNLVSWLQKATAQSTPIAFLYGERNFQESVVAQQLSQLANSTRSGADWRLGRSVPSAAQSGQDLLDGNEETIKLILEGLADIQTQRDGQEWQTLNPGRKAYSWIVPSPAGPVSFTAKQANSTSLLAVPFSKLGLHR